MSVLLQEFANYCADQNVGLAREIIEQSTVFMAEPACIFGGVIRAGRLLRKTPGIKLAKKLIPDRHPFQGDVPAAQLARMVNASIRPVNGFGLASFRSKPMIAIDACPIAEENFADHLRELKHSPMPSPVQIFVRDKKPILLRKSFGIPSALTLSHIAINGIPYPPMSLVRAEAVGDTFNEDRNPELPEQRGLHIVPAERINKIAFMRLTSFCLPRRQRKEYIPGEAARPQRLDERAVLSIIGSAMCSLRPTA